MRFTTSLSALLLGSLLLANGVAGEKFEIDASHSNVLFTVRHMVIAKVTGKFKDFSGTIIYDEKDLSQSSVNVTIKVASIDTENEARDKHLRSEDFFNAAQDSLITFTSRKIEKRGEGFVAVGDLTMRGVTKEIVLPFTLLGTIKDPWGNKRLAVEARTTINRFDYGVKWDKTLEGGNLIVGKEVEVNLNIEAIAKPAQAPKL
ncbi:MAG: YceI family protein [candidate division KSB1 bacterium]|nr:YceI family protein [candidate division KSB1 bacterium]MDZ7272699.1 YceI family protein [candidate division KSB1 bacterium]MDZ7284278.1 YceI family protein [candidate division KSB1 bacterium]MDZ7297326.1 YceI family protein [candidate division KSB1 bacterium]MDZ7308394.1 YceI family protein [candidate division KSB1 bacterium]